MSCFVLQISAGAGPSEVRPFMALLAARVEALARARGVDVLERDAAGAPPRSVRLTCAGPAGAIADLVGTHALVHAARGRRARKRWFVGVSCHHVTGAPPPLAAGDVVLAATRSRGPGGQRVNKVSSAVRAHHLPSGIAVRADGERSQVANRRAALARVAAELAERARAAGAAAEAARRAEHYRLVRGGAAFTYRLVDGALQPLEP